MAMRQSGKFFASVAALLLICVQPVMAQSGKLKVHVNPREAYIYADGKPVVEARNHSITLPAGEHKIDLYNYGYKPESRNVTIEANKTARSMSPCKRFREPFPGRGDASRWKAPT